MDNYIGRWPHRTYCDVLQEMRDLLKNDNHLPTVAPVVRSLVEELQVYGSRMEASLSYEKDIEELHQERKVLVKQIKELKAKKKELEDNE